MTEEKKTSRTRRKPRKIAPDSPRPSGRRKPSASPVLTEMLGKLSAWTPDSDEQVLEVANRLGQAAREEIDRRTVRDSRKFSLKMANDLVGRVLSTYNGIGTDYEYVAAVERDPGAEDTVIFRLLYFTRFNRVGDWGMYRLNRSVHLEDIQFFPTKRTLVISGREKRISGKEGREVIAETISTLFGAIPKTLKEQILDVDK